MVTRRDVARPRARALYGEFVDHLQGLVRSGAIDPDRLLAGDTEALAAYVAEQERWLAGPTGDGGSRMDALLDEAGEEFLAAWDAADAESLAELDDLLAGLGDRPCTSTGCVRSGSWPATGSAPPPEVTTSPGTSRRPTSPTGTWNPTTTGVSRRSAGGACPRRCAARGQLPTRRSPPARR